jgi:exodeoxyribonuclease-3
MKIISWNVNGIRATYKKGLLSFLENEDPDIFCVQETKAQRDQLTEEQIYPLGMKSFWSSAEKKGYSGVATFCHNDPDSVEHGIGISKFDSEGRFVVTKHKDIFIYNVYFPNGARPERHDFKQEFLAQFTKYLKHKISLGEKIVVLGDYNVAPAEIDVFDPVALAKTSGFLPEEREWFKQFQSIGFVDTFRHFHPNLKNKFSWWNQIERARLSNRGWRIDLICVSKNLEARMLGAEILDDVEGSDHCPVVLHLKDSE